MPAITFPFNYGRIVYLEDGTRATIPRGTLMTVKPTVLFQGESGVVGSDIFIPMGDGADTLDRSTFGRLDSKEEMVKLEHLIHDSSAGPLAFTSVMHAKVFWDMAFRGCGHKNDFRGSDSTSDLFIADISFYTDSRKYRPIIVAGPGKFPYQTAIVREKHLNVCLRIEQYFYPWDKRDAEPSFFVQVLRFRPEIIYGGFDEEKTLFFTCSVWDVLLRHHLSNWSEQDNGGIVFTDGDNDGNSFITPATTPVFFRKAMTRA